MKICQSLLVSKDGNFDQAKRDDVLTGRGAFTNYVCIFWHLTTYTVLHMFRQVLFGAGNQGNHQNFEKSLLTNKL